MDRSAPSRRLPAPAAVALGFALGGFFDGILLHQVLQWHHLLSAVDAPGFADLRVQVMADGLFHLAMYVIAVLALWRLLAGRDAAAAQPGDPRRLLGSVLLGFAAWHTVDAVLAHWLLGIHRIRMDSAHPLAWDLGWWAAFGLVPAAFGWRLQRDPGDGGSSGLPRRSHPPAPAASGAPATRLRVIHGSAPRARRDLPAWAAVTVLAGLLAAVPAPPPDDGDPAVVVVVADGGQARLLAALPESARVVGVDRSGTVWQLRLGAGANPWNLYGHGAWWVAGGAASIGCAARAAPFATDQSFTRPAALATGDQRSISRPI